jgi:hypothetical protein
MSALPGGVVAVTNRVSSIEGVPKVAICAVRAFWRSDDADIPWATPSRSHETYESHRQANRLAYTACNAAARQYPNVVRAHNISTPALAPYSRNTYASQSRMKSAVASESAHHTNGNAARVAA